MPAAMSGVTGLDDILAGGFARNRLYLVEGSPGTGKTTLALQFLINGAAAGERVLYVTLSETEEELRASAAAHGWSLDGIDIFELVPPESLLDADQQQSLLYSSDLELGETTTQLFQAIERTRPSRIVLDSLSELRLLAQGSLRYRRQVLTLKHYVAGRQGTVMMLDDLSADAKDYTLHSVAHGVIRLEELAPEYGAERRRLRVVKYRGRHYRGGFHDFAIRTGGLVIFPRLVSAEHRAAIARTLVGTGIAELDQLLGGGVERGTSTLLIGPTGTGKSLLSLFFVRAAIARGERAAMFVFDEEIGLLGDRAGALGIDLPGLQASGNLSIEQVDAAELSPGEFTERVRRSALAGAKTVVIDSINGYQTAMPEEKFLVLHMHELLQYLNRLGANTFLTVTQHGLVGDMASPVDVTYLADTVLLMRYFESEGLVRRAISTIKKRAGAHEKTIREFQITSRGLRIGAPLHEFQGVLRGVPVYVGSRQPLLSDPAR